MPAVSEIERHHANTRSLELGRGSLAFLGDDSFTLATLCQRGLRWPNITAVVDDTRSLSFAELHQQVRASAAELKRLGVRPGSRVAVLGERNIDTLVAILSVATVGAAYVALDPRLPKARLEWLLADAEICATIADGKSGATLSESSVNGALISLEPFANLPYSTDDEASFVGIDEVSTDAPAYVLYTSGSTGRPKGVQISHRSILSFFLAHNERANTRAGDRWLSTGPFYFDVSVMDVLLPLYFGATVYFAPPLLLPKQILQRLSEHRITHFYAVGTLLGIITGDGHNLERFDLAALELLQTGAEVCNVRVVNEWLRRYPRLRFLNSYGPTEVTVGCLSYLKDFDGPLPDGDCPIGKPHRGTKVLVVDDEGNELHEPGLVGELVVAGPQLMVEYWRRPAENQSRLMTRWGERYYRTGDFVFVDAVGNYHFVGRRDEEVKLFGYRIHLNEIRMQLERDPLVASATVGLLRRGAAADEIVAGLTWKATPPAAAAVAEVHARVQAQLARHMIPTRWLILDEFPRLPSGKTDREQVLELLKLAIAERDAAAYTVIDNHLVALESQ